MKICKACNKKINSYWTYCGYCGSSLSDENKIEDVKEDNIDIKEINDITLQDNNINVEEICKVNIEEDNIDIEEDNIDIEEIRDKNLREDNIQIEEINDVTVEEDNIDFKNVKNVTLKDNDNLVIVKENYKKDNFLVSDIKKPKTKGKLKKNLIAYLTTFILMILLLFSGLGYYEYYGNKINISFSHIIDAVITSFRSYKLVEFRYDYDSRNYFNYLRLFILDENDNTYILQKVLIFVSFISICVITLLVIIQVICLLFNKKTKLLLLINIIIGIIFFISILLLKMHLSYDIYLIAFLFLIHIYTLRISIK